MQPIKIILSIALFTLCTACGSEMDMELEGVHSAQQEEVRAAKVNAKKAVPAQSGKVLSLPSAAQVLELEEAVKKGVFKSCQEHYDAGTCSWFGCGHCPAW